MTAQPPHNNRPDNQADWLEKAKKLMEWNEDRYGEPTLLEYLRYYKSGTIGEVHIEAAITTKIAESQRTLLEELLIIPSKYIDDDTMVYWSDFNADTLVQIVKDRIAKLEALKNK